MTFLDGMQPYFYRLIELKNRHYSFPQDYFWHYYNPKVDYLNPTTDFVSSSEDSEDDDSYYDSYQLSHVSNHADDDQNYDVT